MKIRKDDDGEWDCLGCGAGFMLKPFIEKITRGPRLRRRAPAPTRACADARLRLCTDARARRAGRRLPRAGRRRAEGEARRVEAPAALHLGLAEPAAAPLPEGDRRELVCGGRGARAVVRGGVGRAHVGRRPGAAAPAVGRRGVAGLGRRRRAGADGADGAPHRRRAAGFTSTQCHV
jgi:hypothetical protein